MTVVYRMDCCSAGKASSQIEATVLDEEEVLCRP